MENVQDFYPLAPLQEGLLFQTLYAPGSGVYVTQLNCVLSGNFDVAAFEGAWRQVIARHGVLRSFFVWKDLKKPVQVVPRNVELPLEVHDWRRLAPPQQEDQLKLYLQEDRARGFDLSSAPLMRLALMRLGTDEYQFVWSFHHLLLDGWSVGLLFKDFFAFYGAQLRREDARLPPVRSYRDYIVWLQRRNRGQAEAFWRQYLKGIAAPTPLPPSSPAPQDGDTTSNFGKRQLQLSVEFGEELQLFARRNQLTLSSVVHAAWALLLSRHSGEQDVLFGSVAAGRPADLPNAELMVGLFINTIPVRVRLSPDEDVSTWLKIFQDGQAQARQYEYSSLLQVREWSDMPRGKPLFESALVYENYPVDASLDRQREQGGNLKISRAHTAEQVGFPLSLMVVPGLRITLTGFYDTELYDEATVSRLLGHYQTILESIVARPHGRITDVEMLPAAERTQVLVEWNSTQSVYPDDKCVHQLFEEQVEQRPNAAALVMGDAQLSYRELNRRANQLSHRLRKLGVGPEARVGIMMERSVEMIVALLGVLKAGGAYVPLDPRYPAERLAFMLQDANVSVLLTQQRLFNESPREGLQLIHVDAEAATTAQEPDDNPRSGVAPSNIAYIIYTSGSTGRPKGVMVEHRGLCNLSQAQIQAFDLRSELHVLQFASLSFDASIFEIVMALCVGATLHLDTQDALLGAALLETLKKHGITNITMPPSMLATLAPSELPALRTIIAAGEACPAELAERWGAGRRFFNAYGPTETTVWASVSECVDGGRKPTIGRPIANAEIYLLDAQLKPVPVGVVAELCVAGAGLARGYFNRPEVTAEKFVPHPFSPEPGARLYRTGDLARYLPNGEIDYIGRVDHQVKVRGFRIEPGEIEAVLEQHPAVQSATVAARGERLIGYVLPVVDADVAVAELRTFMQRKVPHFMVPGSFVLVEEWPLTANGKIDRNALPEPDGARVARETEYVAPHTEAERIIAGVWQGVLNIERVGLHDNFFDLGGHSLSMLQVQSKLQHELKKVVPLVELFEYPTVKAMAEHFSREQAEEVTFNEEQERAGKQREALARQKQRQRDRSRAV